MVDVGLTHAPTGDRPTRPALPTRHPGGYYGYVTSQYTNALQVVDVTPPAGGLPTLAGKVFLGSDGVGGQGVLPVPIAYEGWVERAVAAHAPLPPR
jgi:hypothetical protein